MTALVIYHANCYDGFTAAWVARQAIPDCELFEGRYGEEPPYEKAQERAVYIIDFSYPRDQMVKLNEYTGLTGSLKVLDHHKTAESACAGLSFCEFDMDRSGAGMAWDYWNPITPRPRWIDNIEDRDLWNFKCTSTAEVHAYVASLPMTMENWDLIDDTPHKKLVSGGASILGYINTSIGKALEQSRTVKFAGHTVAVLNITYQNASETAGKMLDKYPTATFSLSYFQRQDARWQYSLRSRSDFDVSEIAKEFGGGGHAQAAGFETDRLLMELEPCPS